MAHSVQRVSGGPAVSTNFSSSELTFSHCQDTVELQQLAKCCSQIQELAPAGVADNETMNHKISGVSHLRVGSLISQVKLLASRKLRLPVPRYFFQTLQTTSIKLSVGPQPKVVGEPVSVPQGSQLALKVEGVLRHGKRASLFRSVDAICVTISTSPPSKATYDKRVSFQIIDKIFQCSNKTIYYDFYQDSSDLEQIVVPHRDFFACEFLLSLGSQNTNTCGNNFTNNPGSGTGGQYQVTATANIVDKSGNVWKCGPRSVLQVRVHEEPSRKKLS